MKTLTATVRDRSGFGHTVMIRIEVKSPQENPVVRGAAEDVWDKAKQEVMTTFGPSLYRNRDDPRRGLNLIALVEEGQSVGEVETEPAK